METGGRALRTKGSDDTHGDVRNEHSSGVEVGLGRRESQSSPSSRRTLCCVDLALDHSGCRSPGGGTEETVRRRNRQDLQTNWALETEEAGTGLQSAQLGVRQGHCHYLKGDAVWVKSSSLSYAGRAH